MSLSPSSPMAAADSIPVPKTALEKTLTTTFDKTGLKKRVGSFMSARTKLLVLGIVGTIVSIVGLVEWSGVATKVEHVKRGGGCLDSEDLDAAHTTSSWNAIVWGIASSLFLVLSGLLAASYFV